MAALGDTGRLWITLSLMLALACHSSQKLIRAHVDPDVSSPNYYFTSELPACRGSIFSSQGRDYPFVKSIPCWEYHLDPVALAEAKIRRPSDKTKGTDKKPDGAAVTNRYLTVEEILGTISTALSIDEGKLRKMAEDKAKRYQFLAISSDSAAHDILANSRKVAGVVIEDRQVRKYIHGNTLSHVLGAVNAEYTGTAGIEQRCEKWLKGKPGRILGMKDANGREIYDKRVLSVSPTAGADVYLTVNPNLQFEAENALKWGIAEFGANAGWCIVMDPTTGAILAMASNPDFDPEDYRHTTDEEKINRAVAFNYEPGSVMKVITAAVAIENKRATPNTVYRTNRDDDRYFRLPGDGSHNWDPTMTIRDAIVHSSNIVIGKLGYDLGPEMLWTGMRKFGFGEKTGVELPGEQYGILPNWKKWDKLTWSRAPIGQGVSVTAMQLASAYQAIANDGVRLKPYIIDKVVSADGKVIYEHEQKELGRPISASTARTMRSMMSGVVAPKGTARKAAIKGYTIAGKTGTAQKNKNGVYLDGLYRASFCGMIPAGKPQVLVLVSLDFEARTLCHQGGNSAGPIFKRIASAALRYLMIPGDKPEELEDSDGDEFFDKILDERTHSYGIIYSQKP